MNPVAAVVFSASRSPVGLRQVGALTTRGGGDRVGPVTPGHVDGGPNSCSQLRFSESELCSRPSEAPFSKTAPFLAHLFSSTFFLPCLRGGSPITGSLKS